MERAGSTGAAGVAFKSTVLLRSVARAVPPCRPISVKGLDAGVVAIRLKADLLRSRCALFDFDQSRSHVAFELRAKIVPS